MEKNRNLIIAAVGDIHMKKHSDINYQSLLSNIFTKADVLLLLGDLTDHGKENEAQMLASLLLTFQKPIIAVMGNHDYDNGEESKIKEILQEANVIFLDEDIFEYKGVGFAGVKGFGGGFDQHMLYPFGENTIKDFVNEAINEEIQLEKSLTQLNTEKKVVLLHYAPISQTVVGENPEIFPYLGSSRLEFPINQHSVNAVFHGHAHHGTHMGKTKKGIPVYNASYFVMERLTPLQPYAIVEI